MKMFVSSLLISFAFCSAANATDVSKPVAELGTAFLCQFERNTPESDATSKKSQNPLFIKIWVGKFLPERQFFETPPTLVDPSGLLTLKDAEQIWYWAPDNKGMTLFSGIKGQSKSLQISNLDKRPLVEGLNEAVIVTTDSNETDQKRRLTMDAGNCEMRSSVVTDFVTSWDILK